MPSSVIFPDDYATAIIAPLVKPGREADYEEWMRGIIPVAKTFPGHLGVHVIRPQPGGPAQYITMLHFDRPENLKAWLDSDARREWIERVRPLVEDTEQPPILTGLETWFQLPRRSQLMPPKRYKMVLITWLGVFVTLTVVGRILQSVLAFLPPLLLQFITVGVVVGLLTYVVMPQLTKIFRKWLYPTRSL